MGRSLLRTCIVVAGVLGLARDARASAENDLASSLVWTTLPPLPDKLGFAGPFAGVSNGALIVAGGANFPDGPPWEDKPKVWHDRMFVLAGAGAQWQELPQKLERPLGYGVSITVDEGVVCIGGSDATAHYADVFKLAWKDGRLERQPMPPLPAPLANACGALVGRTIYVAGGTESPGAARANSQLLALDLDAASPAWRALEPCPGPERMLAVAGAQGKSFYLISGARLVPDATGVTRQYLRDAWRYTPGSGWQRIADLPRAAVAAPGPAAPVGPSHLFVFGGDDGTSFFRPPRQHAGFARDVLAYHAITDTWTTAGTIADPRAVTALIPWAGGWVVPSGEVRAGVRSPACDLVTIRPTRAGFGWINYLALALYPMIMLGISYLVGRKSTSDEFFRGGQRIPWWAAGISIYATMLSSITYMAIPAKAYATDWSYFISTFAIVALAPVVAFVYLPFFRRLDVTSAYEYLELRFNLLTRWFGSASFLVLQLGRTAIVLYLPALALATVTQFDITTCILAMGLISILMTFLGGVEAVVWTDVAQTVVLLAGVALSLVFVIVRTDMTVGSMIDAAALEGKFFGHVRWDWEWTAATGSVIFFGSLLSNLVAYTASQDVVQRYLTTRNQRQAARAILANAAITIPSSVLFFALGTALFIFYKRSPERLEAQIMPDAIYPLFMVRELPAGVAGIVVAGIFAAAQPTSNLNSMATAFVTDFYRRARPGAPDALVLRLAQWLTVLFGTMGTAVALVIATYRLESLWDLFLQIIALTGGALAGLFALGIFTTAAHGRGAIVGAAASVATLYLVQQHTHVNFFLYGGIGILTCFAVGLLASLVLPDQPRPLAGLTVFTLPRPGGNPAPQLRVE